MKYFTALFLGFLLILSAGCDDKSTSNRPVINSFTASADACNVGSNVTLSWDVSNADTVSINNGVGDVGSSGNAEVTVTSVGTNTWTLTASNSDGNSTSTINVTGRETTTHKLIGGAGDDQAWRCGSTSDGGLIIVGYTESSGAGGEDAYLVKLNANLQVQWEKTFGGTGNDQGYSVEQTLDGGYIIGGNTESYGAGGSDGWIIKTDAQGNEEWSRTFGGAETDGRGFARQLNDGTYIFSCWMMEGSAGDSDFYLARLNAGGEVMWTNTTGYQNTDGPNYLIITSDNNYVLYGEGNWDQTGEWQGIMAKFSPTGSLIWSRTFGSSGPEEGYCVVETPDRGFAAVGYSHPQGESARAYLLKTDRNGYETWFNRYDFGIVSLGVALIPGGGFMMAGSGSEQIFAARIDANGNELWRLNFGGSGSEMGTDVKRLPDGNYLILGVTNSYGSGGDDIIIIKIDENGQIIQ